MLVKKRFNVHVFCSSWMPIADVMTICVNKSDSVNIACAGVACTDAECCDVKASWEVVARRDFLLMHLPLMMLVVVSAVVDLIPLLLQVLLVVLEIV